MQEWAWEHGLGESERRPGPCSERTLHTHTHTLAWRTRFQRTLNMTLTSVAVWDHVNLLSGPRPPPSTGSILVAAVMGALQLRAAGPRCKERPERQRAGAGAGEAVPGWATGDRGRVD